MVNASRRKCGAESSQDTRMKSMNEIESRNMRLEPIPFGGTVQKSGHRCASPERFVKALADEIGDACVHAKRECENNTAYAPTRYVTRNGNKRKRLSGNWHKTILVKQSSTQRQPALRRFVRVCVYIQGVAAVIDALSKDQAFFGMHSLYETCGNKKINNKESTESLHNDIYKMRVAICSGREAQPVSSEQPYTGDRDSGNTPFTCAYWIIGAPKSSQVSKTFKIIVANWGNTKILKTK